MAKYRKKPVIIEARQLVGTEAEMFDIYRWIEVNTLGSFEPMQFIEPKGELPPYPESGVSIDPRDGRLIISTLEGLHWADRGDWIICGVQGEFYPCKPDIFAKTYDAVERNEPDQIDPHGRGEYDPVTGLHEWYEGITAQSRLTVDDLATLIDVALYGAPSVYTAPEMFMPRRDLISATIKANPLIAGI